MRGSRGRLTAASIFVAAAGMLACGPLGPDDDEDTLTHLSGGALAAPDGLPQCLASPSAVASPALVRSRLASLLTLAAAKTITPGADGYVCLSRENGRWRLRRALTPGIVAE